ncbi:MAG: glycosyltransferase family 2 protein [Treponema sp.]|nr:glycosyltransferase family 2 protein [Candidatus Treponema equifaecale]
MFFSHSPKISICIPLFNSERFLESCLKSVKNQVAPDGLSEKEFLEVIVVNDASESEIDGEEIVKKFRKSVKFKVSYFVHEENKGLVEARRTAIYEAKGKYILILDSDDALTENAAKILYEKAEESDADIVQGRANVYFSENVENLLDDNAEKVEKFRKSRFEKANKMVLGELKGSDIFDGFLVNKNHIGFLWGKLFKRELYLEALNHIPPIFCTFAEDFVQYFYLSFHAKKYVGIDAVVYNYSLNTGISSRAKINDLAKWEKICSTASVFTSIYCDIQENSLELSKDQKENLAIQCRSYLANNLKNLETAVVPELKSEAREILGNYWGEDFVQEIEEKLKGLVQ